MSCQQCDKPASHDPVHIGGVTVPRWSRLCCEHMDMLMAGAATLVEPAEGRAGWATWQREHRLMCGPHVLTLVPS